MQTGKVEKVVLISHISTGLDYCNVTIDFDEIKVFGDYNNILAMLNKTVIYETALDMYQGESITRAVNFYEKKVVQTLEASSEQVRLIPRESSQRAVSNFAVDTLKRGHCELNCIALLTGYTKGVSNYAKWVDLELIDRNGKQFAMKMFTNKLEGGVDPDSVLEGLVGNYVRFNPKSTAFGIQTDEIEYVVTPVVAPPEVEIAKSQIEKFTKDDEELRAYMTQYEFIDVMEKVIYGEPGYHLVEIASELAMIETLSNISNEYDIPLMIRAAITSRGYLLPSKAEYSKLLLNTNKVLRSELKSDKALLDMLDVLSTQEKTASKCAYYRIKKFCKQVIEERRGISNEESDFDVANFVKYL